MRNNENTQKLKVLYFVDSLALGGIQSFFMEYIPRFDPAKVEVEILVFEEEEISYAETMLKEHGITIHKIQGLTHLSLNKIKGYLQGLNAFFYQRHDYQMVELHSSSKNVFVLTMAKKYGIKIRIAHAHNTRFLSNRRLETMIGNFLNVFLRRTATTYFACSTEAGYWMFGKGAIKKKRVTIIHNAIDVDKFKFNAETRTSLRKELGVGNELIIGQVGRFTEQKNHQFLVLIFQELLQIEPTAKWLLVGNGPLEDEIKRKVETLGLTDSVIFLGFREDRNDLMQAMDVLVCPSLFEGLGIVLIEAQAAGMVCFASKEAVPFEAKVTELLKFVSLNETPRFWAEQILAESHTRQQTDQQIIDAGYDSESYVKELEELYQRLLSFDLNKS